MNKMTCRYCGRPLYERVPTEASPHNWFKRPWLSHGKGSGTYWENDDNRTCSDGKAPLPKEICKYSKSDGDDCSNPVRHEEIEAGNFACGVHMKKYLEDREAQEAAKKRQQEQRQREEIDMWELGIYQETYARLHAMDPELFPLEGTPKKTWRGFDRNVDIDIVKLERFVREYAEANAEG